MSPVGAGASSRERSSTQVARMEIANEGYSPHIPYLHRSFSMPIATPEQYNAMIDSAKAGGYAYPAVNVTSSQTLNAAIRGFAEAESDGIIQVSTGGAAYWSGSSIKNMVTGSLAFAAFAREVAK